MTFSSSGKQSLEGNSRLFAGLSVRCEPAAQAIDPRVKGKRFGLEHYPAHGFRAGGFHAATVGGQIEALIAESDLNTVDVLLAREEPPSPALNRCLSGQGTLKLHGQCLDEGFEVLCICPQR